MSNFCCYIQYILFQSRLVKSLLNHNYVYTCDHSHLVTVQRTSIIGLKFIDTFFRIKVRMEIGI